jgi:hypothetical protein
MEVDHGSVTMAVLDGIVMGPPVSVLLEIDYSVTHIEYIYLALFLWRLHK